MQSRHHIVSYKVPHNQIEGLCGVSIFQEGSPDMAVVVLTEFERNPGMSVTNAVDIIATKVKRAFLSGVPHENIIWVERYEAKGSKIVGSTLTIGETFDLVTLSWIDNAYAAPHWRPVGKERSAEDFWRMLFQSDRRLAEFPRFADIGAVKIG